MIAYQMVLMITKTYKKYKKINREIYIINDIYF